MDAAQNDRLTRIGPGTDMGEVLRRHWAPIAAVTEFETERVKPVRLLGEDLVLYRDLSGGFGLVQRQCAHRRADLSYGFVEACGLRCNYHGWAYDASGQCIEQPYEDTVAPEARFKDKVKITAYPVQPFAGMVWAYLGPQPAPLLPNWEPFGWKNGFVQVVISEIPCNWLQCQENSIDPVHFEWMHTNWSRRQKDIHAEPGPRHLKVGFDEFDYGLIYRRQREDLSPDHSMWTVGRVCLWPNGFFLGDHFEWRVPIDDENTLSVAWMFERVPSEQEPYVQAAIPAWRGPVTDAATGRWISSHVMNQDFVAWVGQGRIADRTGGTAGAQRPRHRDAEEAAVGRHRGGEARRGPQGRGARPRGQRLHRPADRGPGLPGGRRAPGAVPAATRCSANTWTSSSSRRDSRRRCGRRIARRWGWGRG